MTGGITKGQIVAGCIGLVLLLGIGYWAIKKNDDSGRKRRGKSKKKLQKDVAKNKQKHQRKRKYSDSESSSSKDSSSESSEIESSSELSNSDDSIDVAPKHRKTSKKEPSRSGKAKKSSKNPNLKLRTNEPTAFQAQDLPSTKKANPLKIESVLMEKKKPEVEESSQFARS